MRIKVLWIDDECNDPHKNAIIGSAEQDEIDFVGFESHEEGMLELEGNLSAYDAVVLDAKVKYEKGSEKLGLTGLKASRDKLIELNSKGIYLPYFIFTGQPGYMDNEMFAESYGEFYTKSVDEERLLTDLRDKVENKEEYLIQERHRKVFTCASDHLGEDMVSSIVKIIAETEAEKASLYRADFTSIRMVVERIYKVFYEKGLIPIEVYGTKKGPITACSKFLSSHRDSLFEPNSQIMHPTIAYVQLCLLSVIQDGSHGDGFKLRLAADAYVKDTNSSYLYRTCVYQLLEFICWTKDFLDSDPQKEDWTKNKLGDGCEGTIINRNIEKGFAFFKPHGESSGIFIPPYVVPEFDFGDEDIFRAIIEDYSDRNTGETKQRVKNLEKVKKN